ATAIAMQKVALVRYRCLPLLCPTKLVTHHVEKKGMVRGENDLDGCRRAALVCPARSPAKELREVTGHGYCVIVIQRGDGIVDVKVFLRLIGDVPIKHPLADSQEKTPDEDVLLATGNLDIGLDNSFRLSVPSLP